MEELISIASAVPLVLSVAAFIASLVSVRGRARADREFVDELSKSISAMTDAASDKNVEPEIKQEPQPRRVFVVNSKPAAGSESEPIDAPKFSIQIPADSEHARYLYKIYFSGVKGRGENKELPDYVKKALENLDKRERKYIVKALKQPSIKGRMRYFDKVLKQAFGISGAH